ncbi:NAD(P)-dependent oxidoreductase [Frisingicoccus sp.]|uniref:2-hydroxyacid dehydrogenase n=1 Tax=Frisingicoccus sp. TaxID=1918627 RepID=UPI0015B8A296
MKISLLEPIGISQAVLDELSQGLKDRGHEFCYYDTKTTDVEELKKRTAGCDIVMIANNPYPAEVIESADALKMISVAFTGIDHIGVQACRDKDIMICNAAGYSNQTVAELVIGMAIDGLRNVAKANEVVRKGGTSAGIGGREICGRTVGIIGLGKIGLVAAKLFLAFGAKVIAYNRSQSEEAKALGIEYKSLEEVLSESDIVSLNMPLNDSTRGFISADKIALMKPDAVFINCARGPIVDNEALAKALNEDKLGFACLDVFDMEPPIPEDYPMLHAKNTLLTPHQAFISEESMIRRAKIVFDNVYQYLDGAPVNVCK